jgi:hypothetical protein
MATLSAAIAKHTVMVTLADGGKQLMQVPMISMPVRPQALGAIGDYTP